LNKIFYSGGFMIMYFLLSEGEVRIFPSKFELNNFIYRQSITQFSVYDLHLEPLTEFDIRDHLVEHDRENKTSYESL